MDITIFKLIHLISMLGIFASLLILIVYIAYEKTKILILCFLVVLTSVAALTIIYNLEENYADKINALTLDKLEISSSSKLNVIFKYNIINIEKELNKENIYEISLTGNNPDFYISFDKKLKESYFVQHFGIDNNQITGSIYILKIKYPYYKLSNTYMFRNPEVYRTYSFYKFSIFGQEDFTQEEIEVIKRQLVEGKNDWDDFYLIRRNFIEDEIKD